MLFAHGEPEIRRLRMEDVPDLATVYCGVFNAPPWNDDWTQDTASKRLTDTLETPGSLGFLLLQEGKLIGGLIGYQEQWFDGAHFFMKEMFVDQVYQRRGVGTHLMRHLKHTLGDLGVNRMYLLTARESVAADFYVKQGFYVSPRMSMMACRLKHE